MGLKRHLRKRWTVSAKTTILSMSVPPEQDIDCSASKQTGDPIVLFCFPQLRWAKTL